MKDHYETLGIPRDSTIEDIKKAYRQFALKYHPDRNPGNKDAESKFKLGVIAHEILSDPIKKSLYDIQGFVGRRPNNPSPPTKPSNPPPFKPKPKPQPKPKPKEEPKPPPKESKPPEPPKQEKPKTVIRYPIIDRNPIWDENWNNPKNPPQYELDAIQCEFFGPKEEGRSILMNLRCSPHELQFGCKKILNIKRKLVCQKCQGTGKGNKEDSSSYFEDTCWKCNGVWIPTKEFSVCPKCEGSGKVKKCIKCEGTGMFPWQIVSIPIHVPPHSRVGNRVILNEGEDADSLEEHKPENELNYKMPGKLHVVLV